MKIDNKIKECPYCGSDEYYIKQSFEGKCRFRLKFNGKEADNSDMHEGTTYKNTSNYAWCNVCNKRLFKLD